MKKLMTMAIAGLVLGMAVVSVQANCGKCAPKKPACAATATCKAAANCPMAKSLQKIDLTKDQQAKIAEICKAADCGDKAPKDKEARKAWAAKRKECRKQVMALLTPEQKQAMKKKPAKKERAEKPEKKAKKGKKAKEAAE